MLILMHSSDNVPLLPEHCLAAKADTSPSFLIRPTRLQVQLVQKIARPNPALQFILSSIIGSPRSKMMANGCLSRTTQRYGPTYVISEVNLTCSARTSPFTWRSSNHERPPLQSSTRLTYSRSSYVLSNISLMSSSMLNSWEL